jgi:anti-sigma factor (TIGR02949 family)
VSFFESLKRLFTGPGPGPGTSAGTGQSGQSGGMGSSGGSGPSGEVAVAMISCDEAAARLFEYLDGELESMAEAEVRQHLEVCEACYPRAQFEKHFLEALRRSQDQGGGRVSESLRARVLEALEEEERSD